MHRGTIFLVLVLGAAPLQAAAQGESASANHMISHCRNYVAEQYHLEVFVQGFCLGRVDAISWLGEQQGRICAPSGATRTQAVRVVVNYLESRPARMHEPFNALANEALRAAWPCKSPR